GGRLHSTLSMRTMECHATGRNLDGDADDAQSRCGAEGARARRTAWAFDGSRSAGHSARYAEQTGAPGGQSLSAHPQPVRAARRRRSRIAAARAGAGAAAFRLVCRIRNSPYLGVRLKANFGFESTLVTI